MPETAEDLIAEDRAEELLMSCPVSAFHATTLALPIPGAMGPDASVYLAVLEMQGLAPGSRYEYHRELTRLATMFPHVTVPQFTRATVERYLVQRTVVEQRMSVSSRRKIMACLVTHHRAERGPAGGRFRAHPAVRSRASPDRARGRCLPPGIPLRAPESSW